MMRESLRLLPPAALVIGSAAYAIELPSPTILMPDGPGDFIVAQPRPDFQPQGIDLPGGLILRPEGHAIAQYDDNVYRVREGARGDEIIEAVAGFDLRTTEEKQDYAALSGAAAYSQYRSLTHEDHLEYWAAAEGETEPSDDLSLAGRIAGFRLREPRGSAENVRDTVAPTLYSQLSAFGEARYDIGSSYLTQALHYDNFIYGFSGNIDNRDRDRNDVVATTRLGHEIDEESSVFLEAQGNSRSYLLARGFDGYEHSSSGYHFGAGIHYEVTGLSFLDVALGWLDQNYVDPRFHPIEGPYYRLQLTWYPTDLISVSLTGERRIEETDEPGAVALSVNSGNLRFAFDLDENLIAGLGIGFSDILYRGTAGHDQAKDVGANLRYLLGPNLYLTLGWTGLFQQSNLPGLTYHDNQISLDVSTQW